MLANNFLTAAELKIEEKEHAALIQVMGMLLRGEAPHVPAERGARGLADGFNMSMIEDTNYPNRRDCGTARCIGGYVAMLMGVDAHDYVDNDRGTGCEIGCLYYPFGAGIHWDEITPVQAAMAIRNYLTSGDPDWPGVGAEAA